MASEPETTPAPGSYVGKFRVERFLGAGAMGEVLLALDEGLGRRVAVKILGEHATSHELRERFVREARAVANLNHPNVVQVFAIDTFEGRPFYAMEYLPGRDLGALLRQQRRIPQGEAVRMLLDAARGLREASQAGIIHRDVKPSNLVLTDRGTVKVTDFGLAKQVRKDPGLTEAGVVLGTPDYIAPEQARGEPLDPRTDVYALGCTLYHLVSGRPPFRRASDKEDQYIEVVTRHITQPVPDLAAEVPDVDPALANLCKRMMAKRPEDRPAYDALIPALESLALRIGATGGGVNVSVEALSGIIEPPRRRVTFIRVATVVSALLFVISVVLTLVQQARNDRARARAALQALAARGGGTSVAPPPGYLAIDAPDGDKVFVATHVVTFRQFARIMGTDFKYDPAEANRPVTGISYLRAADFAMRSGARVVTDDEWLTAYRQPGFVAAPGNLCEWVWDDLHPQVPHFIRCAGGARRLLHKGMSLSDVTFRLAMDQAAVLGAR